MNMKFLFFFILMIVSTLSYAIPFVHLEPFLGIGLGESKFSESAPSVRYSHDGYNIGIAAGGRAGLELGPFAFGLTGSYGQQQIEMTRSDNGIATLDKSSYDLGMLVFEKGAFAAFYLPKIYFLVEYFVDVDGKLKRSESDAANPFQKNAKISGEGFSLGVGFKTGGLFNFALLYKKIEFDELPTTSNPVSPLTTGTLNLQLSHLF